MQTEYMGTGSIRASKDIAASLGARRILLITGKESFTSCGAEAALYRDLGSLELERFSDFAVNPRLEDACRGIRLLRDFQPDLVVATGGGSVLDMGKLITTLAAQPRADYAAVIENSDISSKGIPLVAIPTTAGTGSEATHFAVVYVQGSKFSLAHRFLLPDYVIIDPELTYNTDSYQTAVSGMDALCQGVESYWSVHSTKQSREFASEAIRTILSSLDGAALEDSKTARQKMAWGAYTAGKAINLTKTTAPHALSYTLTSRYDIPHGHGVALMLGKFFLIHTTDSAALIDQRGMEFFSDVCTSLHRMFGCTDAASCAEAWYRRMEALGLETDLAALGITGKKHHDLILDSVNPERLANHPVKLTRKSLSQLFK